MQLKQTARDALLKPLQAVSGIVERRHTLPILANVLLEQKRRPPLRDGNRPRDADHRPFGASRQGSPVGHGGGAQAPGLASRAPRGDVAQYRDRRQPDDGARRAARASTCRRSPPPITPGSVRGRTRCRRCRCRNATCAGSEIGRVRDGPAGHPLLPQRHAARDRQRHAAGGCHRRPSPRMGESRHRRRLSAAGGDPAAQDRARARQASGRCRRPRDDRHPREPGSLRLRQCRAHEQGGRRQVSRTSTA